MSTVHYLFLFGNIFFIFISLTNTANLDILCGNNTQCGGPGAICLEGKCQCDTPYYTPCNASECNIENKFVYEGDECRVDANCLDHAQCSKLDNRCRCMTGYTSINGLCYKNLNANCTDPSECLSGECRNKICQCPLGFIPGGNRCQRKLARIYPNWADAKAADDFCYAIDSYSCLVSSAICQNDPEHSEKFCQCPSAHTADYGKQECNVIVYNELSPSNTTLLSNKCGKCLVDNALCAFVGNQTTCWCQASFTKIGDKCVKNRLQPFIFPNHNDTKLRDYTWNCSMYTNDNLCACAPGDQFINQTCQPIKPEWKDNNFEYGVCTHMDSKGKPTQDHGLCPRPLKCEARQDKYVCSCGRDRYLDENVCHYFLGRNLTEPDASYCPVNSTLNGTKCQCELSDIFSVSLDNKRCELKLNETGDSQEKPPCDTSSAKGDASCARLFGENAKFCRKGECRCMLNSSYYANNRCVTLIYAHSTLNMSCPANAEIINDLCECKRGYRVETENNRTCVPKVTRLNEKISSTANALWNLTIDDCKALFSSQPVIIVNDTCTCDVNAFFNGTMCFFYLGHPSSPSNDSMIQCPGNANASSGSCKCNSGYKETSNTTCEKWTTRVYPHNETTGENLTGITSNDCVALFGSAADISENQTFCQCRNGTVAFFWDTNKCYFRVEIDVGVIDSDSACPPGSKKTTNRCNCPPSYQTNQPRTACERKPIPSNLQAINIDTFGTKCNGTYTDNDCEAFYGPGAVCRDNQCYCDRSRSYIRNNRCELFSRYIFPGIHEYYLYTCDVHDDCGDNAEKNGIVCEFFNETYRVCQCKQDYFFNPINSTCVPSQCYPTCLNNEECQNYECNCKIGYHRNSSGQCVIYDQSWKLHEQCNKTHWDTKSEGLECSYECERIRCSSGYRDDGSKCVKYSFDDHCVHNPDLCSNLSPGSQCNTVENKCACSPDYYQTGGSRICARAVGLSCVNSIDCGEFGDCLNQTCACKPGRIEKEIFDFLGRKIKACTNGIDQIQFNPVLFVFIIIVRVLFA